MTIQRKRYLDVDLELTAQIKGQADFITLSEDGRWIAIIYSGEQHLFDAYTGQEYGKGHDPGVISTDGKLMANMRDGAIQIFNIDGKQVIKPYPHPGGDSPGVDLCFTADSQRLWVTLWNEDGTGKLALVDAETLEELDAVPMPVAAENDETTWMLPFMTLHIPSDTLALQHVYSDAWYLLGVFFFTIHEKQIKQHDFHIPPDSDLAMMSSTAFSASGQQFAGIVGSRYIWVWQMQGMNTHQLWNLLDDEKEKMFVALTFIGEQLIALVEDEGSYELCVVDVDHIRLSSRSPLPSNFVFPPYLPPTMRGRTLVGMQSEDVVIYRIGLKV